MTRVGLYGVLRGFQSTWDLDIRVLGYITAELYSYYEAVDLDTGVRGYITAELYSYYERHFCYSFRHLSHSEESRNSMTRRIRFAALIILIGCWGILYLYPNTLQNSRL